MKKNIIYLILLIILLLYLILGHLIHFYIPCIFHMLTGLYCPGCGLTRMLYSIIKLDFYHAFRYNPLLFIMFPFMLLLFIDDIYSTIKQKQAIINKISNYIWYILIVVLILYGIIRNIYSPLQPID